jgi:hypothetical protein
LIRPNRISGVISVISLADDTKYAAETVDYEVVGVVAGDIFEQPFALALQHTVLALFEGRQMALGGVKYDPGRLRKPLAYPGFNLGARKSQIGARLGGGLESILDP